MAWPTSPSVGAGADRADAAPERLEGHLAEAASLERRGAGEEHPAGVAVPAVEDHGDVDVEDVAVLQPPLAGIPWQTSWLIEVQIDFG